MICYLKGNDVGKLSEYLKTASEVAFNGSYIFNSFSILDFYWDSSPNKEKLNFAFLFQLKLVVRNTMFKFLVWNNSAWTNNKTEEQIYLSDKDLGAFCEEYLKDQNITGFSPTLGIEK